MRYNRQIMLPEIGNEGQAKLKAAKVLIVGVGGLGSPIALYLTGAGVGTIGLVDNDEVSISNIHRRGTWRFQSRMCCYASYRTQQRNYCELLPGTPK